MSSFLPGDAPVKQTTSFQPTKQVDQPTGNIGHVSGLTDAIGLLLGNVTQPIQEGAQRLQGIRGQGLSGVGQGLQALGETGLRTAGGAAKSAVQAIAEPLMAGAQGINQVLSTPESEARDEQTIERLKQTPAADILRQGFQAYQNLRQQFPNATKDIDALGNILMVIAGGESGIPQSVAKGAESITKTATEGTVTGIKGLAEGAGELASQAVTKGAEKIAGEDVNQLITRAVRPSKKFAKDFERALPEALPIIKKAGTITDLHSAEQVTKSAQQAIWSQVENLTGNKKLFVDGTDIAKSIESVVKENQKLFFENPDLGGEVQRMALNYHGAKLPLPTAEDFLEQSNDFLRAIRERHPTVQGINNLPLKYQAELKINDALRKGITDVLTKSGNPEIVDLKRQYGKLAVIRREIANRIPINDRLAKFSLGEQFNIPEGIGTIFSSLLRRDFAKAAKGIGQIASTKVLKTANTADFQIKRAFDLIR